MRHDNGASARADAAAGQRGVATTDAALRRIADALHDLRYGAVTVIVQDGVVVQIERTEKTRLDK